LGERGLRLLLRSLFPSDNPARLGYAEQIDHRTSTKNAAEI
jgi:hypothetical protein